MATLEALVSYMYGELSPEENRKIEEELQLSWPLREKFAVLKESYWRLERINLLSPRKKTIAHIMEYAAKTSKISSNLKA